MIYPFSEFREEKQTFAKVEEVMWSFSDVVVIAFWNLSIKSISLSPNSSRLGWIPLYSARWAWASHHFTVRLWTILPFHFLLLFSHASPKVTTGVNDQRHEFSLKKTKKSTSWAIVHEKKWRDCCVGVKNMKPLQCTYSIRNALAY